MISKPTLASLVTFATVASAFAQLTPPQSAANVSIQWGNPGLRSEMRLAESFFISNGSTLRGTIESLDGRDGNTLDVSDAALGTKRTASLVTEFRLSTRRNFYSFEIQLRGRMSSYPGPVTVQWFDWQNNRWMNFDPCWFNTWLTNYGSEVIRGGWSTDKMVRGDGIVRIRVTRTQTLRNYWLCIDQAVLKVRYVL